MLGMSLGVRIKF